ncbi:Zinc finger protein, partial [Aphelenchoides avenae]
MSLENVPTLFKCVTCGKEFSKYSSYRIHVQTHIDEPHACDQCKKKYKLRRYLLEHKRTAHAEAGQFECDECGKICPHKKSLAAHKRSHRKARNGKLYECDQCEKKYKWRAALLTHKRNAHAEDRQLECDECGELYPHKRALSDHKRCAHSVQEFECPVCGKKLRPGSSYLHMKTHSDQPCECDVCGKVCPNSVALAAHKRRVHSEDTHRCEHCGKLFALASILSKHIVIHDEERKEYSCTRCSRTFKSIVGREHHLQIEHSDTRFTCDSECGLDSATRSEYREHLKSRHSQQHPATCKCVTIDVLLAQKVAKNLRNTAFVKADGTLKCTDGDCDFATTCA